MQPVFILCGKLETSHLRKLNYRRDFFMECAVASLVTSMIKIIITTSFNRFLVLQILEVVSDALQ